MLITNTATMCCDVYNTHGKKIHKSSVNIEWVQVEVKSKQVEVTAVYQKQ